jgi:hypothetical protein
MAYRARRGAGGGAMTATAGGMRRLEVFVHIGKTAGSTLNALLLEHHARVAHPAIWAAVCAVVPQGVRDNALVNRHLARALGRGYPHLEFLERSPVRRDRMLAECQWVSGHVQRRCWDGWLADAARPVAYHTILRDPVAQVASHYQWWIEIHDGNPLRYWRYGRFWRGLSARIRATDNSDPRAIIAILAEHHSLFLNLQTDYVLGPRASLTETEARAALGRFESIGVDADFGEVFTAMTGAVAPLPRQANRSRAAFDRAVFDTAEMRAFLAERNAADIALYAAARRLRGG